VGNAARGIRYSTTASGDSGGDQPNNGDQLLARLRVFRKIISPSSDAFSEFDARANNFASTEGL
jgi:hypothetical protein